MLHVPTLKPGDQPFDPDFAQTMTPWKAKTPPTHSMAVETPQAKTWGTEGKEKATPAEQTPEERIAAILNLAVVKEAVTALHRAEDDHMRALEDYGSARICDIPADHDRFLREQTAQHENACKNEEQKALFRAMTKTFLAQSRARAQSLQHGKTMRYWQETVEAQNEELLARALRPENLSNDQNLTMYRDLILFNMENMLAQLPEGEKQEKLRAAEAAFYRKVLEKRLEDDPPAALALMEKADIRNILGETACEDLSRQAALAVREQEFALLAQTWADGGKTPAEAEALAERCAADGERAQLLALYDTARFEDNQTLIGARTGNIMNAWERLKADGFAERALPRWIARTDPELAACLRDCLRRCADAGGGEGATDYTHFLPFLRRFEKDGLRKTLEHLREEKNLHSLLLAAGGPEGSHWGLALRLLGGAARPGDKELAAALLHAWGEGRSGAFMRCFAEELNREEEKSPLTVRALVRRVEEGFPETEETNEE